MPFALLLACSGGLTCFKAVLLFSLFVVIIITLHVMELGLG
jgi:hypothetical protein